MYMLLPRPLSCMCLCPISMHACTPWLWTRLQRLTPLPRGLNVNKA